MPRRRSLALLPLATLLLANPARAAGPADFVAAIARVLRVPEVYLASTTPSAPLMLPGQALHGLDANTRAVVGHIERLIEGAEHEVLLQIYEWDDTDEAAQATSAAIGRRIEAALAAGTPLAVRVVVGRAWPAENALQQRDLLALAERLRGASGRADVRLELASYRGSPLSILHTKTLIVDAQRALVMTGNFNTHGGIEQDSLNVAAELRGSVVRTLRSDWLDARRQAHLDVAAGHTPTEEPPAARRAAGDKARDAAEAGPLTVAVLARTSNWTPWTRQHSGPHQRGIVALIDAATEHICIINPSLGAEDIKAALVRAIVLRGVRVDALVSLNMNRARDHHLFGGDNAEQAHDLYTQLLAAGGRAAAGRLRVRWGSVDGVHASPAYGPGNVHAKISSFDGQALLVGSSNFNWLSMNNSRELSVAIMGEQVADDFLRRIFAPSWTAGAPLRAQDWPHHAQRHSAARAYLLDVEADARR